MAGGMNILAIGQSHVAAIRAAARVRREADADRPRTRVIHTLEPRYDGEFADAARTQFTPALIEAMRDQVDRYRPRLVSVIGGNAHNALALMRHPRPFDFLLPGEDGPPPDLGAEHIPHALVSAVLTDRLQADVARLAALRALIGPFLHIESPPPVRDEGFIAARAEAWFRAQSGEQLAVAGSGLRWRVWRLASRLVRAEVERLGCRYLPVPGEVQDGEGFLRQEFAADPTHGNAAYGEVLIRAVEAA